MFFASMPVPRSFLHQYKHLIGFVGFQFYSQRPFAIGYGAHCFNLHS